MYEGEKKKDTEPCIITSPFEYLCGGVCVCVYNICKGRQKPLRIMVAFWGKEVGNWETGKRQILYNLCAFVLSEFDTIVIEL